MPLSRDPETLKIPAFMRKERIHAGLKKPLVLTALDRKNNVKSKTKNSKNTAQKLKIKKFKSPALMQFFAEPKALAQRVLTNKAPKKMPKLKPEKSVRIPRISSKQIGTVTHYYAKIQVGVIALTSTLTVGDYITYETQEGPYKQIVESMEINRQPVFKAGKGKEIGLKLRKEPKVGGKVSK